MKKIISTILLCLATLALSAQDEIGNGIIIDKMTHDFGDVLLENGPLTCSFTIQNRGDKPAVIYNVVTSCGCTDVKWTREPIRPGGTLVVKVIYEAEKAEHFNKTVTVYCNTKDSPLRLTVKGTAR